jgi:hypothetical protein
MILGRFPEDEIDSEPFPEAVKGFLRTSKGLDE